MKRLALVLLVACSAAPPPKRPKSFGMCRAEPASTPVAREEKPPRIDRMVRSHLATSARCISRSDKGIWCWGKDDELFGYASEPRARPSLVKELGTAESVANGYPTCVVDGGDVVCFDRAMSKKLGDAVDVATGAESVCVVRRTGSVACWGMGYREPFDKKKGKNEKPPTTLIDVPMDDASAIAMNASGTACVTRRSGRVTCWAEREDYAHTTTSDVKGVEDAVGVAVSTHSPGFVCALRGSGDVLCWGQAGYGELGKDRNGVDRAPARIDGVDGAVSLATGGHHACVVTHARRVFCWGANDAGQLGDGSTENRDAPVRVAGIDDALSVVCGDRHTCVERANGVVSCWGNNRENELGDGQREPDPPFSVAPVAVIGLP